MEQPAVVVDHAVERMVRRPEGAPGARERVAKRRVRGQAPHRLDERPIFIQQIDRDCHRLTRHARPRPGIDCRDVCQVRQISDHGSPTGGKTLDPRS